MFSVDITKFRNDIRKYAKVAGKSLDDALEEEAKLTAKRLMELTPPKNAKQGKNAVRTDINKLFLRSRWFLDVFNFRNTKLDEQVKKNVRAKNEDGLREIFSRSEKLSQIRIQEFDSGRHKRFRNKRTGRVNVKTPNSFPLGDEGDLEKYTKAKEQKAGRAKGGWSTCLGKLGGKVPAWLRRFSDGSVTKRLGTSNPSIEITNLVDYARNLDARMNIVSRALSGRQKDLAKKIQVLLDKAAGKFNR